MTAPEGTIVNPRRPAPVAARGLTGFRIANAVLGALAQAVPERVPAAEAGGDTGVSLAGYDAQDDPFVLLEFLFGSWGGRPFADGPDGVSSVVVNFANNPAEVIEAEHPIAIDRYEFVPDSGGDGRYRGWLGHRTALPRCWPSRRTLNLRSDRRSRGPYGLQGGEARRHLAAAPCCATDERIDLPGKGTTAMRRGDVFEHRTAGGGGWGPPEQREAGGP